MSDKCLTQLSAGMFIDNELTTGESQEAEAHIKTCSRCQQLIQHMEKENAQIREVFCTQSQSIEYPDFTPVVIDKLSKEESLLQYHRVNIFNLLKYRWPPLTAAASILLVAFLLVFLLIIIPTKKEAIERGVILCSAKVDGHDVQTHLFKSDEPDIQFIWLEKEK